MTLDVERIRADTPGCAERIHFNNSGSSLMPRPVFDTVVGHIELETRIGGYEAARSEAARCEAVYDSLARLVNAKPHEIAVVENATRGWDMVFYALRFGPGDRILTSVAEYASNYIAFLQVARRTGAVIEAVPNDPTGALDPEALAATMDDRVKLVAITHVPTNGGLVNPAAAAGAIARAHGVPFLLDACQSIGQIPIDVEAMNVDMLSATSRKYLRGPRGIGFVYVREPWIERLEPPFLDMLAATWTGPERYEIRRDARRFENWERNFANQLGMGAAADYALGIGLDAIRDRVSALAERLRAGLAALPGVTVRDLGTERCGIVSFTPARLDPVAVRDRLAVQGINISTSGAASTRLDMQARGIELMNRAGVHYFNTDDEVDRVVEALGALV